MNELDKIKEVESAVSGQIEHARKQAEALLAKADEDGLKLVEVERKRASVDSKKLLDKSRFEAEYESNKMMQEGLAAFKVSQAKARKNFGKAVDLVLSEFGV